MSNYWLLKSEPDTFSLKKLKRNKTTHWDGVRNYQARNFLSAMAVGDLAFFYHSRVDPPGVVGICRVVEEAAPDPLAWNKRSPYYDPKASPENPRWVQVKVEFVEEFRRLIGLGELKETPGLEKMRVTHHGRRLSVQPVTPEEWAIICAMGREK